MSHEYLYSTIQCPTCGCGLNLGHSVPSHHFPRKHGDKRVVYTQFSEIRNSPKTHILMIFCWLYYQFLSHIVPYLSIHPYTRTPCWWSIYIYIYIYIYPPLYHHYTTLLVTNIPLAPSILSIPPIDRWPPQDAGSDSEAPPCAWHVLAELPTDASEGEAERFLGRKWGDTRDFFSDVWGISIGMCGFLLWILDEFPLECGFLDGFLMDFPLECGFFMDFGMDWRLECGSSDHEFNVVGVMDLMDVSSNGQNHQRWVASEHRGGVFLRRCKTDRGRT